MSIYSCEVEDNPKYSPYRVLNRNLVSENRKEGLKKVSKYSFLLLSKHYYLGIIQTLQKLIVYIDVLMYLLI